MAGRGWEGRPEPESGWCSAGGWGWGTAGSRGEAGRLSAQDIGGHVLPKPSMAQELLVVCALTAPRGPEHGCQAACGGHPQDSAEGMASGGAGARGLAPAAARALPGARGADHLLRLVSAPKGPLSVLSCSCPDLHAPLGLL